MEKAYGWRTIQCISLCHVITLLQISSDFMMYQIVLKDKYL